MARYIPNGTRKRDYYEKYIAKLCGEHSKGPYKSLIGKLSIRDMQYLIKMIEEAQARAIDRASQMAQDMGYEKVSKAIDCNYDL